LLAVVGQSHPGIVDQRRVRSNSRPQNACYTAAMVRRLRIAASVFFGLVTVALCVLSWRSYRYRDEINYRYWPDRAVEIVSIQGRVELENGDPINDWPNHLNSHTLSEWKDFQSADHWGFSGNQVGSSLRMNVRHYVLILAGLPP
jgi:hypothetical protein